jgi:NAD(P)-dependent dehydrogenase (short-subunit alcohol dehydrogenase family)
MLSSIKGRLYTVTGVASGIGRATAIKLSHLGVAGVSISDVNEAGLKEMSRSGIAVFDALVSCKLVGRKSLYISTGRGVMDPLIGNEGSVYLCKR